MFLVNVRCYICLVVLSVLGFVVCAAMEGMSPYFRRLRKSYLFAGVIYTIQACFIDVVLCSVVQFKNVSPSRHG